MGDVIALRPRAAEKGDAKTVLAGMMEQEASGELEGAICIAATSRGTKVDLFGSYSDRMQLGVLAMVKGLNFMCDKIVSSGTAGNTPGAGPITLEMPRRTLPRRLREATNFGELD